MSALRFEDVIERLKTATGARTDKALADELGVCRGYFNVRRARGSLPCKRILHVIERYNLSADHIFFGRGR